MQVETAKWYARVDSTESADAEHALLQTPGLPSSGTKEKPLRLVSPLLSLGC